MAWTRKSIEIRERDKYLCQVCLREGVYNYECLEVHHAIPLEEDFDRRLDNDALVTLCEQHHEMAERREIGREVIMGIIDEQENII